MTQPATNLHPLEARLLNLVQQGIPYVARPFLELGRQAGVSEDECLTRLRHLRDERHIIRQVSAIFDTHALGYQSSLVAGKYESDRIDAAAAVINQHPGVSHNYRRNHVFNLWYTLAVPPDSALGLERTIARLHELSGAMSTRALPTLKLFKIGVRLNVGSPAPAAAEEPFEGRDFTFADRAQAAEFLLTEQDKRLIGVLQQNLELTSEPFAAWAQQAGCSVAELLAACARFEERRQMRRFAAVLHHRQAGFAANVMGVWRVAATSPPAANEIDRCGAIMARCPAVSHCYQRPAYADWPYSLYTMVHGKSPDDCLNTLEALKAQTGCPEYAALWSVHEYKKVRVQYFTPETAQWEAAQGGAAESRHLPGQ